MSPFIYLADQIMYSQGATATEHSTHDESCVKFSSIIAKPKSQIKTNWLENLKSLVRLLWIPTRI